MFSYWQIPLNITNYIAATVIKPRLDSSVRRILAHLWDSLSSAEYLPTLWETLTVTVWELNAQDSNQSAALMEHWCFKLQFSKKANETKPTDSLQNLKTTYLIVIYFTMELICLKEDFKITKPFSPPFYQKIFRYLAIIEWSSASSENVPIEVLQEKVWSWIAEACLIRIKSLGFNNNPKKQLYSLFFLKEF